MYIERGGERERGLNVLFLQHYKKKRKKNAFSFPCFSFALCCSVFFFFKFEDVYIRTSRVSSSSLSKALFPSKKKKNGKLLSCSLAIVAKWALLHDFSGHADKRRKKKAASHGTGAWCSTAVLFPFSFLFLFFLPSFVVVIFAKQEFTFWYSFFFLIWSVVLRDIEKKKNLVEIV